MRAGVCAGLCVGVRLRLWTTQRPAERRGDWPRAPGALARQGPPAPPRAAPLRRVARRRRRARTLPLPLPAADASGPTHGAARAQLSSLVAVAESCDHSSRVEQNH